MALTPIERRMTIAGLIIATGLAIQLVSQSWVHPLAFVAFLVAGIPLVGLGVLTYLYSLVSAVEDGGNDRSNAVSPPAGNSSAVSTE